MDIRLPQLSEGADSGTVVSVSVKPGDTIEKDQTIIELENDKAVAPIPATEGGTVSKVHVSEGDEVSVGDVILTLGEAEEKGEEKPAKKESKEEEDEEKGEEKKPAKPKKQEPSASSVEDSQLDYLYESRSGFPPPASPSLRKLARDIGLDLRRVRGTGRGGRIVLSDIRAFVEKLQEIAFTEKGGDRRKAAQQQSEQSKDTSQQPTEDFSKWGSVKRESLSSIRKTIGQKMQQSWTSIPHVYQFEEADITSLMKLRKKYKSAYSKKGTKLTLTALVIKAAVHALKEHPLFNASLDQANGEIVKKEYFHIGIAVDTEAGLLVPVIRDADQKDLVALSNELQEIAEKARNRELSTDEMKGSSFTISNLGGIGGTHFTPIVNQPNVAILGVGRGMERPVAKNGKLSSHTILPLCVSYDHRVIDGADGARFIKTLVEVFENFKEDELKTK